VRKRVMLRDARRKKGPPIPVEKRSANPEKKELGRGGFKVQLHNSRGNKTVREGKIRATAEVVQRERLDSAKKGQEGRQLERRKGERGATLQLYRVGRGTHTKQGLRFRMAWSGAKKEMAVQREKMAMEIWKKT